MEGIRLARAKRIMSLAQNGLGFSKDPFDHERHEELARLASETMADLGNVPVARTLAPVPDYAAKYATPSLDVRGRLSKTGAFFLCGKRAMGGGLSWGACGYRAIVGRKCGQ